MIGPMKRGCRIRSGEKNFQTSSEQTRYEANAWVQVPASKQHKSIQFQQCRFPSCSELPESQNYICLPPCRKVQNIGIASDIEFAGLSTAVYEPFVKHNCRRAVYSERRNAALALYFSPDKGGQIQFPDLNERLNESPGLPQEYSKGCQFLSHGTLPRTTLLLHTDLRTAYSLLQLESSLDYIAVRGSKRL